jgi:hypothetical protein
VICNDERKSVTGGAYESYVHIPTTSAYWTVILITIGIHCDVLSIVITVKASVFYTLITALRT